MSQYTNSRAGEVGPGILRASVRAMRPVCGNASQVDYSRPEADWPLTLEG